MLIYYDIVGIYVPNSAIVPAEKCSIMWDQI